MLNTTNSALAATTFPHRDYPTAPGLIGLGLLFGPTEEAPLTDHHAPIYPNGLTGLGIGLAPDAEAEPRIVPGTPPVPATYLGSWRDREDRTRSATNVLHRSSILPDESESPSLDVCSLLALGIFKPEFPVHSGPAYIVADPTLEEYYGRTIEVAQVQEEVQTEGEGGAKPACNGRHRQRRPRSTSSMESSSSTSSLSSISSHSGGGLVFYRAPMNRDVQVQGSASVFDGSRLFPLVLIAILYWFGSNALA